MPNIKISDLAPIALPAVGDETFFEVQTVAAGEDVSRKISLDEIVSSTGLDASFLTVSANAQLPNERVLTAGANISLVDTGPNGTLTINATAGGVSFPLLAPDGTNADPSYSWSSAPSTGIFLIATNLMGFSILGTTNWEMGGLFQAANNAGPAMQNTTVTGTVPGLLPSQQDGNTGIGSNTVDQLSLIAGGAEIARATEGFNANQFAIIQSGSTSVPELTSLADPDTGFRWPANNTTVWIGGGSRTWNFSTAKFFSEFSNGPALLNEISSDTNPTVVADHADPDTGIGSSGNDEMSLIAGGVEAIRIDEVAGNVFITYFGPIIVPTASAGAASVGFDGDPDTGYFSPVDDAIAITAGGIEAQRWAELSGQIIQTNSNQVGLTASVTQTQAGGLALLSSYNEVATVGTTGDALTAFAVVAGTRLIVINNGANSLQLFPAVGDDIGAGVDTAITIAAGELGIFIGRDATNWDTLYNAASTPAGGGGANVVVGTVDGQVVIWDVGNNQYEPVSDSILRINPTAPPTSPLGRISSGGFSTTDVRKAFLHQNIGASVGTVWSTDEEGGTPSGFYSRSAFNGSPLIHDWGFWDPGNLTGIPIFRMTSDQEFIFNLTAFFDERAAAQADVAGRGQFWVRNDVPNTPMFTDDVGTDFELNASGISFPLLAPDGTAGAPSYSFSNFPDTGIFLPVNDAIGFATAGTLRWTMNTSDFAALTVGGPILRSNIAASALIPTVMPHNVDVNTGLGRAAADQLSLIAGGVEIARAVEAVGADQLIILPADTTPGTAAAPALQLGGSANGFFIPFTNQISVSIGGTDTWKFDAGTLRASDPTTGPGLVNNGTVSLVNAGLAPLADNIGTGVGSDGVNTISLIVDGRIAVKYDETTGRVVQTNDNEVALTASVTQTQAGGLLLRDSYNEIATVANEGDAVTAFAVAAGHRLIVTNNGANGLQLFPAVGDNFGAGVDASITIAANSSGIFIGRDATNWDQLQNQSASGSVFQGLGPWRYRTEITSPPATGQVRFNNADPTLATEMFLHETNANGTDVNNFLNLLSSGALFYIQDRSDSANFFIVEISSNTDNGTDRTFGIANITLQGVEPSQNSEVAIVAVESGGVPRVANDVAQARRTTGFILTTAFVDVTLDTTDVESDAAVLNHDLVTNTDNIIIGATGTYKVSYEVDIEVDTLGESTITADGRVRVNDGGVGLPGSDALCGVFSDGSIIADFMQNHLSQSFYVELTSGDFITLQLEKVEIGGTDTYTATRVLFTAERCL